MKKLKVPPYLHDEVYRGIRFYITAKRIAVFDEAARPCRDCCVRHWDFFFTKEGLRTAASLTAPIEQRAGAMRAAIDNALTYFA